MTAAERERLSAEDRKRQIVEAALPIFAQKGFKATTTKEIAQAAGVSEALLYKHFPSKELMFRALDILCVEDVQQISSGLGRLEPSTQTLVTGIYFLVRLSMWGLPGLENENVLIKRLMTHSLLDDGQFAKVFLDARFVPHIPTIEASMRAAEKAGDLDAEPVSIRARIWMAHNVPFVLHQFMMPGEDFIDHGASREEYLNEAVRFVLRGLGVRNEAIRKHFDPKKLSDWMERTAREMAQSAAARGGAR